MCESARTAAGVAPLDAAVKASIQALYEEWSSQGFRVLGVASRVVEDRTGAYTRADERGMCLAGFLLFLDPAKDDVRQVIVDLAQRGVQLKMITGDNIKVARHVAATIGLPLGLTLTGRELNEMSDEALWHAAQ